MKRMVHSRYALVACTAAALLSAAVSGCSSLTGPGPPPALEDTTDPPQAEPVPLLREGGLLPGELGVSWLADGRIEVTTWGSSSCPAVITELRGPPPSTIVLGTKPSDIPDSERVCSADMAPHTSVTDRSPGWPENSDYVIEVTDTETLLRLK